MEPNTDKDFINPMDSQNTDGIGEDATPPEKVEKFTDWENEPSIEDIKADFTAVQPEHDLHVNTVKDWLDALYVEGKYKPKKRPGRSGVQPKLIRKQAEWRYAALSEPFLGQEDMFTAKPVTFEDKTSAEQNQLVLNTQFRRDVDRTKFIDEYVRTAVNEGTAILRTGWHYEERIDEVEVPVYDYVESRTPKDAQMMNQLAAMFAQNPDEYAKVPEHYKIALSITMETGIIHVPYVKDYKTEEQVVVIADHPTVEVCDFEDVMIDPTCEGKMEKANFVIYRFESSLAQLKKQGDRYSNLDYIENQEESILAQPDENTGKEELSSFRFKDNLRKKFYAYEYWGFWDIHKDGILRPILVTFVNNTIIEMKENPYPDGELPFITVPYLPIKRSVYGEPDGVLIADNQAITGAVTRGMIDIMGRSANGQVGIRKDMLDPINRRKFEKGDDYEFNPTVDVRQGVYSHVFPEIPQSAPFMLQLQNFEAESLTGVKSFSGGLSGDALGKESAAGVRGVLDAASKRELGILRRLANGLIQVGRKFMAMNTEFLDEEFVVRITNDDFVPVRRDDLQGEIDLKLDISTAEEDNQRASDLSFMLQTIGNSMDGAERRLILSEIAQLRKMPALAETIRNYQPQPDPIAERARIEELRKLIAEVNKTNSEAAENYAEAELDQAKAAETRSNKDLKDLQFVEQESGTTHAREVDKITSQASSQMEKSIVEKSFDQLNEPLFESLPGS